ncbi:MAG: hypothetical protein JRN45_00465 [Nitrososphaerota archaeon]|nr:hypothetical protein [Nitrososphaerota archaeon]
MSRTAKEFVKRMTAPEIRVIVREEATSAVAPLTVKIDGMEKRLDQKIDSVRNELKADIARVDEKVSSFERQTNLVREVERLKVEVAALKEKKS